LHPAYAGKRFQFFPAFDCFPIMNKPEHLRRFSMPPPGFVAANAGAMGKAPSKPVIAPQPSTLAQIYNLAHQQAVETVHQRQFNELVDRLFNS
jgi:hypothetical protein